MELQALKALTTYRAGCGRFICYTRAIGGGGLYAESTRGGNSGTEARAGPN
jgi:hypothetical protein